MIQTSLNQYAPGLWRAEIYQNGRMIDALNTRSEAQARKRLRRTAHDMTSNPALDLAGDQPQTMSMEF